MDEPLKVTVGQILERVDKLIAENPSPAESSFNTHQAGWYAALEFIKKYIETGKDPY